MICSHCSRTDESLFYKSKYQRNSNLCKECTKRFIKERKLFLKLKAIEFKGGKCLKCGYNNPASLDFHHLHNKKSDLSLLWSRCAKWERIKEEIEKCELLCANCHRERHCSPKFEFEFDHESLLKNRKRKLEARTEAICINCNKKFHTCRNSKFCSRRCRYSHNQRKIPSLIEIENAKRTMSWKEVAELFKVGKSTIRRWRSLLTNQIED